MDHVTEYSWDDLTSRVPVCLQIDGKPVEPVATDSTEWGVTYSHASGIRAVGARKVRADGVEWFWRIENAGSFPSPCVRAFFPLYLTLPCHGRHAPALHGSRGGLDEADFPPESLLGSGPYTTESYVCRSYYLPSFGHIGPYGAEGWRKAYAECRQVAPLMLADY